MNLKKEVEERIASFLDRCRVCLEETQKLYPLVGPITNVDTTISHMIASCAGLEVNT